MLAFNFSKYVKWDRKHYFRTQTEQLWLVISRSGLGTNLYSCVSLLVWFCKHTGRSQVLWKNSTSGLVFGEDQLWFLEGVFLCKSDVSFLVQEFLWMKNPTHFYMLKVLVLFWWSEFTTILDKFNLIVLVMRINDSLAFVLFWVWPIYQAGLETIQQCDFFMSVCAE